MFNTPPTDAPVTAPEGQGENWEQRFKGLQREYNKRQTELEAAAARATDAENAVKETRTQLLEVTKSSQSLKSELEAQLGQFKAQVEDLTKVKTTIEAELGQYKGKEAARSTLIKAEASDLIPFVDAGALNVTGLEGEALTQHLQTFRGLLKSWGTERTMDKLAGSSPSLTPSASVASGDLKKPDEMFDWLMEPANESKPEYANIYSQYLKATKT